MIGEPSDYITWTPNIDKYDNLGNPIVTVIVNNVAIGNLLIDLGATINKMTTTMLEALQLEKFLRPTLIVMELVDHTMVKLVGVIDDVIVYIASWDYPVYFMAINSKDPSTRHRIILGRPWLATANAFIGCRDGEMKISNGLSTQKLVLYPPAIPVT